MLNKKLQELADYKAKIIDLEKQVVAERDAQLRNLHADLGFESRDALIAALKGLGGPGKKRGRKPGAAVAKAEKPAKSGKKRRKRTKITAELRAQIIAAVKGGATGAAIAKEFGVSLPTVQNIKRAAGLTRKGK